MRPDDDADRDDEVGLDRRSFGWRWRASTWLIVFWTALIAILGVGAATDPANSGQWLVFGWMLLAGIWAVGMVPLVILWTAAWLRRRRNGGA